MANEHAASPAQLTADRIATAAAWLSEHWNDSGQPHTKILREAFGLSFGDAIKAKVLAKRLIDEAR